MNAGKELTDAQKLEIFDRSEQYSVVEMAEKYQVHYNTVYNFVRVHKLKYKVSKPQKVQAKPGDVVSYADLMKERAMVTPDPPRKWQRPPATYSNLSREDLIDKILNDK